MASFSYIKKKISINSRFEMKKYFPTTLYILTMSRCSRLALFSSSSLTTSMWPSLAAEISAVQQSCTHRQPVTLGTPIRLQIQLDKRPSELYVGCPGNGQSAVPTSWSYQVLMGTRCRMDIQECQRLKCERATTVCNASPLLFCVGARASTNSSVPCVIAGYMYVRC